MFAGDRIDAQIGNWIVTMDLLEAGLNPNTRLRAPFRNPSGLRFSISRAEVVPGRVNGQGGHDIVTGDSLFDDSFLVQGNNPTLVINLLQNSEIRSLLEGLPWVHFEIRDRDFWTTLPPDCDELHFLAFNPITSVEELKSIFDLFAAVLHQLTVIGAASDTPLDVSL